MQKKKQNSMDDFIIITSKNIYIEYVFFLLFFRIVPSSGIYPILMIIDRIPMSKARTYNSRVRTLETRELSKTLYLGLSYDHR